MAIKYKKIKPLHDKILVTNIEAGARLTKGGIIIPSADVGKESGIRPRWAEVWAVGSDIKEVKKGEWILISHGRWSRGVDILNTRTKKAITIRQVDPEAILLVADKPALT